ncbi:hypothetical protein PENTCL1PPCAC_4079, partial [Pristionchus entomophagus]
SYQDVLPPYLRSSSSRLCRFNGRSSEIPLRPTLWLWLSQQRILRTRPLSSERIRIQQSRKWIPRWSLHWNASSWMKMMIFMITSCAQINKSQACSSLTTEEFVEIVPILSKRKNLEMKA